jgi:4-hydroxy 2-oxovalerate aldolase
MTGGASVNLVDTSLRDGMHSVSHAFTPEQMGAVAAALDPAGLRLVEVAHGDGLGGSSFQYGFAAASDLEYVEAVVAAAERTEVAVLLLPGIGTIKMLEEARQRGAGAVRVATHCTEADISAQHIAWAREQGMTTIGFLMMSHMLEPAALAEQAALMESYGAEVVYAVDSAGALVPDGARERVEALRERLEVEVGFHAHNNLGCAVGNSLAAVAAGATWVDGSLRGLGAGAGNAATEVLAAALDKAGVETGADVFALMDAAEDVVAPLLPRPQIIDRGSLMLGYAGVYSSFLRHTERAAEKYGVDARELLVELGRRGVVGGQEDVIIEVAAQRAGQAVPG